MAAATSPTATRPRSSTAGGVPLLGVARYALDPGGARRLWTLSEALLADAAGV
ncbi:hypothetical protein ACFYN3_27840 [Streptomyces lavendulae]|uniref:hypothetical protein n=1 Tax=Streptomyces lavendulae TaxID=1914 RepID=UPI0036B141A1